MWKMKKIGLLLTLLIASLPSLAQAQRPAVYIAPQNGFETYLGAAMAKKGVPIDIVLDQTKAAYLLKAAPVEVKQESTGAKITRCLFASCAGIDCRANWPQRQEQAMTSDYRCGSLLVYFFSMNSLRCLATASAMDC